MYGDKPLAAYTRGDASRFKQQAERLPALYGKSPRYRDKSVAEIIALYAKDAAPTGGKPLTAKTIKRHFSALSTFWAAAEAGGVVALDGLADLGRALATRLRTNVSDLWSMRNGYALPTRDGLSEIRCHLQAADAATLDVLRGLLRVGLHVDVGVTDGPAPGPRVSQIFCSALPVAYGKHPAAAWAQFAHLVLEAAYEATLLAAVLNAARGASNRVLLTRLGGGAFGNEDAWIDAALLRALRLVGERDLDVMIVSNGPPSLALRNFVHASGFSNRQ